MGLQERVTELESEVKRLRGEGGETAEQYMARVHGAGESESTPFGGDSPFESAERVEREAAAKAIQKQGGKPEEYTQKQLFAAAKAMRRSADFVKVRLEGYVRRQKK